VSKRLAAFALIVALAAAVLIGAYLKLRPHRVTTVRGSTTTQFVPRPPQRPPPEPGLAWPTYGYDAQRIFAASVFHHRPPFRRIWTFHGRTLLEFPPVVGYGRVYITTFTGHLVAIDAASGKVLWRYGSGRCGWASPAVTGHVVYETFIGNRECGSEARDGVIAAFDARTGRRRWLRHIGPTESSPLVAHGLVYVGDWNGKVWALSARSGRTRWTSALRGAIKGSLALDGRQLFIGTYGGQVASLDAHTGRIRWLSGGHGAIYSSPAVAYGRVYIGSIDGGVFAFGERTGDVLWSHSTSGYVYASPAVWRGLVLVGSYGGRFYAFDAGTGDVRWQFAAGGPVSGSASVVDGLVYFSTFAEHTFGLEAATGRRVVAWPDGKYSPVVADTKRLYLVGLGRLYALMPRRR